MAGGATRTSRTHRTAPTSRRAVPARAVPGRVVPLPVPGAPGRSLLPHADQQVATDGRTFSAWLEDRRGGS